MDAVTTVWICINLVGAVCVNLGQNVMKLGHNKRAEMDLPEEEKPNIKRIRQWQIGVVVFVGGGVANFVSFGYAPQSLLSALGSIQFVSNVFFASFVLKEKVTVRVVFATACIVGGCILIVVFSASSQEILTVAELMSYYQSPAYITYLCLMFVLMIGFYMVYRYGKRISSARDNVPACWDRLLPVSYAMFCAPIGTQSVLFSKTVSVLLRTTMSGDSQLGSWFTWVMLLAFILTAVFWVTRLNKSLKLFPAIVIVPTMQIGWTIFSIISGGIYFQEFQEYDALAMSMFLMGVSIIMVGVFYLTPPPKAAERYVDMDIDDSTRNLTMASPRSPVGSGGRGRALRDSDGMQEPLSPYRSPTSSCRVRPPSHTDAELVSPADEMHRHDHQHQHQHQPPQQGSSGPRTHPTPVRTGLRSFEEEWANSPSLREGRRTLGLARFSLDGAPVDLEMGGESGGAEEIGTPEASPGPRGGEWGHVGRRSPPSKRHSFSDVSTPRQGSLGTRQDSLSGGGGGEGFAMRLRSFRRALLEDWDLDFSALRQLGGAPAPGGGPQVPGVLGLPMPIMGEWYPAHQQDPRASLSPTGGSPGQGSAASQQQREHQPSQQREHQQQPEAVGHEQTSAAANQSRALHESQSMKARGDSSAADFKSPLGRKTWAGEETLEQARPSLSELRLEVELQGVDVPEDTSADVVIAVVPSLKGAGLQSERRSPTSPLMDAVIGSDSASSEAAECAFDHGKGSSDECGTAADGGAETPAAAEQAWSPPAGQQPFKPKPKLKPVAEPLTADPPPRIGTPQHAPAVSSSGPTFRRSSSDSLPAPRRPAPPPPVSHGSGGKQPPPQPRKEAGEAHPSPATPAEVLTLRPLPELDVDHAQSSPDDSREEPDVTTPLTEGVAAGASGGGGSSARKPLGGASWRRALSGRIGGAAAGGEEDPLSSGPGSGPSPAAFGARSAGKQRASARNLRKGEHEELAGSSGDEDDPPR